MPLSVLIDLIAKSSHRASASQALDKPGGHHNHKTATAVSVFRFLGKLVQNPLGQGNNSNLFSVGRVGSGIANRKGNIGSSLAGAWGDRIRSLS